MRSSSYPDYDFATDKDEDLQYPVFCLKLAKYKSLVLIGTDYEGRVFRRVGLLETRLKDGEDGYAGIFEQTSVLVK